MHNQKHPGLKSFLLLLCTLAVIFASCAQAVTYTEDGGMIVSGDGLDDLETKDGVDSSYQYTSIVTPPPKEESEAGPGPTFAKSEEMDFYLVMADGSLEYVEMLSAGTVYSQVRLHGEKEYVETALLCYETDEVPDEMRYAMINAQKSGYATMHASDSARSSVINRIMTNRVALVLDVGKKYTKVYVDGCVGYFQTSSLTFLPGNSAATLLAKMSYNGKTRSRNTINIHMNGKNKSRILDDVMCGTQMTVFSTTDDGWTEIEADGWHAWVLSKYVTYDEMELSAQVQP